MSRDTSTLCQKKVKWGEVLVMSKSVEALARLIDKVMRQCPYLYIVAQSDHLSTQ